MALLNRFASCRPPPAKQREGVHMHMVTRLVALSLVILATGNMANADRSAGGKRGNDEDHILYTPSKQLKAEFRQSIHPEAVSFKKANSLPGRMRVQIDPLWVGITGNAMGHVRALVVSSTSGSPIIQAHAQYEDIVHPN